MEQKARQVETLLKRDFPDAKRIGDHLVIDRREWVPGYNPDPQLRYEGQTEYLEHFYRCIQCEVECVRKRDFPPTCEWGGVE